MEPKIFDEASYIKYPHHLDNPENIKLIKAFRKLCKSEKKLIRARIFKIWVKSNPKINLFNYLYYRLKDRKKIKQMIKFYRE